MLEPPAPTPRMARSWQSCKVPDDWKKANIFMLQKGHGSPGSCRMLNHTSDFGRIKGQILLEAITRHVKNKRWLGTASFGLAKAQCSWPSWFFSVMRRWFQWMKAEWWCSPPIGLEWDARFYLFLIENEIYRRLLILTFVTQTNISLHRSFQYNVTFLTIFHYFFPYIP